MDKNFKNIKDTISNLLYTSTQTDNKEINTVCKKAINEIKRSPVLKTIYAIYESIDKNEFTNENDAELFLNETFMSIYAFNKNEVINEVNKLKTILEGYHNDKVEEDKVFNILLESTSDKKVSKIMDRMNSIKDLAKDIIVENKEVEVVDEYAEYSIETLFEELNKIQEKYSFISENDKKILDAFISDNTEVKEEIYNNLLKESLNYVKQNIFEADESNVELIGLLSEVENKIKTDQYNNDKTIHDFIDLINLSK